MKVMVIGGGGREHAIIAKLALNKNIKQIYALPGNGGIADLAQNIDISATDIPAISDFAVKNSIDFAVVAPDDPLALGAVDALEARGIPCFGPNQAAARIESSKVFAKNLMQKYQIPTADYQVFTAPEQAISHCEQADYPLVIKADGLALGKGVIIAATKAEALTAIEQIMVERVFGDSGKQIIIEEFISGPEVSVLAFCDGKTLVPLISAMDHKRALDGDLGLNTGGMGVIAPNPYYTSEIATFCYDNIFMPTVAAMQKEGCPFKGCLYFGLMLTAKGPKVIEYNCRFGDPETQAVLPLLQTDLLTIMQAVQAGNLADIDIEFSDKACCALVLASGGYPLKYASGYPITLPALSKDIAIFQAGTKYLDQKLVTAGGRVLAISAQASTLAEAINKAYQVAEKVEFTDKYYRRDIGAKALNQS